MTSSAKSSSAWASVEKFSTNGTAASMAATSAPDRSATSETSPRWSMCWWVRITSSMSSSEWPRPRSRAQHVERRARVGTRVHERERRVFDQVDVYPADREWGRDGEAMDAGLGGGANGSWPRPDELYSRNPTTLPKVVTPDEVCAILVHEPAHRGGMRAARRLAARRPCLASERPYRARAFVIRLPPDSAPPRAWTGGAGPRAPCAPSRPAGRSAEPRLAARALEASSSPRASTGVHRRGADREPRPRSPPRTPRPSGAAFPDVRA